MTVLPIEIRSSDILYTGFHSPTVMLVHCKHKVIKVLRKIESYDCPALSSTYILHTTQGLKCVVYISK